MRTRQFVMLVLILIVLIGTGNSVAYASSLCVHPTGAGRCFTTIQAAVDAADNGDEGRTHRPALSRSNRE